MPARCTAERCPQNDTEADSDGEIVQSKPKTGAKRDTEGHVGTPGAAHGEPTFSKKR